MSLSVKGLAELIQANKDLLKEVRTAMKAGRAGAEALAAVLDERRKGTEAALAPEAGGRLAVELSATMKQRQKELLARIARLEQEVEDLASEPTLQGLARVELSNAYMSLANTYSAAVGTIVPLSSDDEALIAALIRDADLDTERRKQWSAVLGGALSLVKAGLKVAAAVAAA